MYYCGCAVTMLRYYEIDFFFLHDHRAAVEFLSTIYKTSKASRLTRHCKLWVYGMGWDEFVIIMVHDRQVATVLLCDDRAVTTFSLLARKILHNERTTTHCKLRGHQTRCRDSAAAMLYYYRIHITPPCNDKTAATPLSVWYVMMIDLYICDSGIISLDGCTRRKREQIYYEVRHTYSYYITTGSDQQAWTSRAALVM